MERHDSAGRNKRQLIAEETLEILRSGHYSLVRGRPISIQPTLQQAIDGTIHYPVEAFPDLLQTRDTRLATAPRVKTTFNVANVTTFAAARQLLAEDPDSPVFCLNFASAKHPGGGFLKGAQAQEEALARASGLYACLEPHHSFYERNLASRTSLYTDAMIYSPSVPVFRDDRDQLIERPYAVSILTSPAVNAGAVRQNEPHREEYIAGVMRTRTEKLLTIAFIHGYRNLVLGAWGCGVFRNDPADVARLFHEFLTQGGIFAGTFHRVSFGVLDGTPGKSTIAPFERLFRNA
ncbi:MAG: TIGR02452 family protein [Planctomycetaceae bacterium]|nr:TIGR02452 family protein [Planctomycetaceae bacterium]